MATVKAKYLGDLRLECTHLQSGTKNSICNRTDTAKPLSGVTFL